MKNSNNPKNTGIGIHFWKGFQNRLFCFAFIFDIYLDIFIWTVLPNSFNSCDWSNKWVHKWSDKWAHKWGQLIDLKAKNITSQVCEIMLIPGSEFSSFIICSEKKLNIPTQLTLFSVNFIPCRFLTPSICFKRHLYKIDNFNLAGNPCNLQIARLRSYSINWIFGRTAWTRGRFMTTSSEIKIVKYHQVEN